MTFSPATSTSTPEFPDWCTCLVLTILTGLVGVVLRRKRDGRC
jgi:hypothetical protein